jgi:hypothetical protein
VKRYVFFCSKTVEFDDKMIWVRAGDSGKDMLALLEK